MPDRKYKLMFRGDVDTDADIDEVKQRLVEALKTSPKFVESMFTRPETCIKSDLRQELAQKIKDHLHRTGAQFVIVPENTNHKLTQTLSEIMMTSTTSIQVKPKAKTSYMMFSLFVVMFSVVFGLKLWASYAALDVRGPSHILKHKQHVYMISHQHLLQIGAIDGKLLKVIALADLGIMGDVTDINIDEKDNVWLGDMQAQRILRCKLNTTQCEDVVQLERQPAKRKKSHALPEDFAGTTPSEPQFRFRVVSEMDHIYVSETSLNRMRMFDLHGKELFVSDLQVLFPNKVIWENEQLLLADWGNQRIALLDKYDLSLKSEWVVGDFQQKTGDDTDSLYDDDEFYYDEDSESVDALLEQTMRFIQGMTEASAPVQIISDAHGGYWLLCSDLLLSSFQLLHLDKQQRLRGRYEIVNSLPLAIEVLDNGHVLVADDANIQLMQFDAHGKRMSEFGSSALLQLFNEQKQQRAFYKDLSTTMLYVLFMMLVIVIGLYVMQKQRD